MKLFLTASKVANVCQLSALIFCNVAYFVTSQFQVKKKLSGDRMDLSDFFVIKMDCHYFATVYFFLPYILCLFAKNHSRLEICSRYVCFWLQILSYHKKTFFKTLLTLGFVISEGFDVVLSKIIMAWPYFLLREILPWCYYHPSFETKRVTKCQGTICCCRVEACNRSNEQLAGGQTEHSPTAVH